MFMVRRTPRACGAAGAAAFARPPQRVEAGDDVILAEAMDEREVEGKGEEDEEEGEAHEAVG